MRFSPLYLLPFAFYFLQSLQTTIESTMNIQQKLPEVFLHIPPLRWKNFRQAMLDARQDREEVIGFMFCKRHQLTKNRIRYIPQDWIVPASDCYEHQSTGGIVLKQEFHQYMLNTHVRDRNLDVVHVHTHFGDELPKFSYIDDRHEAEYARFLASYQKKKPRLISGVFNESLEKCKFRIWDRKGIYHRAIAFSPSWFAPLNNPILSAETELMFARQKVFGEGVQQQLGQLKVALIGCGGIGAVFAEQLARLGVKQWILIDPDRLETVNLNRMPAATQQMVDQWWHKVNYVKWLIKKTYAIGSHVQALPLSIEDKQAKQEVATADLIVVATDNHRSRQIAQELALEYARPLVCLGTHIEMQPDNKPRLYARVTVPPLGENWCLMCANIINLQQAALESAATEIMDLAEEAGYIKGIDDPAVYWLNSICASTGVGVIHGMISGFLHVDSGLDWIYDFANTNWLKTNPDHLHTKDCYFCSGDIPLEKNEQILINSDDHDIDLP